MVKNCNFGFFLFLIFFLSNVFRIKRGEERKNITSLNSMGPQYITVGSWELVSLRKFPSIPLLYESCAMRNVTERISRNMENKSKTVLCGYIYKKN